MPGRRNQIALTDDEQREVMERGWTLQVASIGHDGWPHLVAMWYALIDGDIHFTTYARAQKALNLDANPRITCMIESGEEYQELRGLVIQGEAEVIRDNPRLVIEVQIATAAKRSGETAPNAAATAAQADEARLAQASKRAVIRVRPARVYSWDHRKLGGTY